MGIHPIMDFVFIGGSYAGQNLVTRKQLEPSLPLEDSQLGKLSANLNFNCKSGFTSLYSYPTGPFQDRQGHNSVSYVGSRLLFKKHADVAWIGYGNIVQKRLIQNGTKGILQHHIKGVAENQGISSLPMDNHNIVGLGEGSRKRTQLDGVGIDELDEGDIFVSRHGLGDLNILQTIFGCNTINIFIRGGLHFTA